jgi:hypothetical protein
VDIEKAFAILSASPFRRKFHLVGKERAYLETWGIEHVVRQGEEIIRKRLAAAQPRNDGRQTPWRNHPIFVAQHATGTCCRGCLLKTHGIAKGEALSEEQIDYILTVFRRWLSSEL